ncbi:TPA: GAF domain-containing protein [Pasteurella multocida]|uniref:GAF domain-containing protein n=1 Tax=Pasteurella multocida TaxID=747 RepID=UPI0007EDE776|nr:GAF domain-containing protein [Pasteurella multocida]MCL7789724.1 GAF domain-containing protein [Pasteurella multocida]OBP30115.1 histidine kinase [Pasteurella multocida subsp. multocida]PNM08419.1 GAF domain-containing protein [Pasteurella multocida]HDR1287921.1 GAF domain-containing protein [Pasteurella multocida]HDR1436095.1 GAF domain-containing protein [Pasteurella multocida]
MNYALLLKQLEQILEPETYIISRMANTSAFLYQHMPELNWVGFYLVKDGVLKVGPFQGKVACSDIGFGKGVCGYTWQTGTTTVVDDVHQFAGHIACDSASQSEVVVPIFQGREMIAELDVDSPRLARFSAEDVAFLENCAALICIKE